MHQGIQNNTDGGQHSGPRKTAANPSTDWEKDIPALWDQVLGDIVWNRPGGKEKLITHIRTLLSRKEEEIIELGRKISREWDGAAEGTEALHELLDALEAAAHPKK